jgi:hypothetical protein
MLRPSAIATGTMTTTAPLNTWLHSFLLVLLFGPVLLLADTTNMKLVNAVQHDLALVALVAPPLGTLALLVPGMVLGWFTRRHPLLVGAAAAVVAQSLPMALAIHAGNIAMGIGHLLSAGLVVAVAALAGRALRHRFRRERVVGETSGTHRY